MKTIYTILPIYDSVLKQDYQRTGAIVPIYCPRHRLPSWQYSDEGASLGAINRIDLVNVSTGALTNITTYFSTLSDAYALSAVNYYKYDGDTLNYLLPYGTYYLKITHASGFYFYSEIFTVSDIYFKLVTGWTNGAGANAYETLTVSGSTITSAVNSAANAQMYSNSFNVKNGEVITFITYLTLNSGDAPIMYLYGASTIYVANPLVAGLNVVSITAVDDGNVTIYIENNSNSNFSCTEVFVIRTYSTDFIRIDFYDNHDLGDIVYQSGFTQSLWLQAQLNTPQHEPVMVGEEKNGIFIAEKIITKFKFRILTYAGPVLYRALIRLPQHSTISIIDEVGFTYTPAVGNIQVSPINWIGFDTGRLEIIFNDNSEFVWTSEAINLT